MSNLVEGVYFSTKGLTREQYNDACQALIDAGANEGEYCFIDNDLPPSLEDGNVLHGGNDKHSNIFGDFSYTGWLRDMIYHFDGESEGETLLTVPEILSQ